MGKQLIIAFGLVVTLGASLLGQGTDRRDERVQVFLKNGHSMIGIAKSGVRCERLARGRFEASQDAHERSTGIRVWFYQDLDGYIFLENRTLDRIDVLGTLSVDESRALSEAVATARIGRQSREAAPSSRPSKKTDGEGEGGDKKPVAKESDVLTGDEKALIEQFPPDQGWGPEKFGEIQRRRIVLHVNPDNTEQAFVDAFPRYQEAWRKFSEQQAKRGDAKKPVEGGPVEKVEKTAIKQE